MDEDNITVDASKDFAIFGESNHIIPTSDFAESACRDRAEQIAKILENSLDWRTFAYLRQEMAQRCRTNK